jgi:hypothetical protein
MAINDLPTIRVLRFWTAYKKRGDKNIAEDWVEFAPISAIMTNRVCEAVDRMRPKDSYAHDDDGKRDAFIKHRWSMIAPAYDAWKGGREIPVNGTALAMWPGVSEDQAQVLRQLGVKTVEEVAAMTDSTVAKVPFPNARELPKQAKMFLDNTDKADTINRISVLEDQNKVLQEELAAAMDLLKQAMPENKKKAVA